MNNRVAILLVLYNEEKHIERLAKSLNKQNYNSIKTYVIDNNSEDNSINLLKKFLPGIDLIKSKVNNGFAKGNNIIARKAVEKGCDYLFVLNTDMELHSKCIETLVEYAKENEKLGVLSPIVFWGSEGKRTNKIQRNKRRSQIFNTIPEWRGDRHAQR